MGVSEGLRIVDYTVTPECLSVTVAGPHRLLCRLDVEPASGRSCLSRVGDDGPDLLPDDHEVLHLVATHPLLRPVLEATADTEPPPGSRVRTHRGFIWCRLDDGWHVDGPGGPTWKKMLEDEPRGSTPEVLGDPPAGYDLRRRLRRLLADTSL